MSRGCQWLVNYFGVLRDESQTIADAPDGVCGHHVPSLRDSLGARYAPGTSVPGYQMPPLSGLDFAESVHFFAQSPVLAHIAGAKARVISQALPRA